jgi:hypothetical protein
MTGRQIALLTATVGMLAVLIRAVNPVPSWSAPPSAAPPAPFVQTFTGRSRVRPQPALPSPTTTRPVKANVDGCDHDYGTVTQCVPWNFPPGTTDKCGWLLAHGFTGLTVTGKDRQHLDPDGDKIAC